MSQRSLKMTVSLGFVDIFFVTAFELANFCCPFGHLQLDTNHGLHLGPACAGHNISHACFVTFQAAPCRFMLDSTPAHSWDDNSTEVLLPTPTPGIRLLRHSHRNLYHSIDHLNHGSGVPLFLRNLSFLI